MFAPTALSSHDKITTNHIVVIIMIVTTFMAIGTPTYAADVPLPHNDSIVLLLDASDLVETSTLASWPDKSGNGFDATQAFTFWQPKVIPNVRHCASAVEFALDNLRVANHPLLNPEAEAFSFLVISKEANMNEANAVSKGLSFYSPWRVGHGGAGGGLSTIAASGGFSTCAARTFGQTDTSHFQVWVGTLAAYTGSARDLTPYLDGSSAGWQSRWDGCGAATSSSYISTTDPLNVGTTSYSGQLLEVVAWKGVELNAADVLAVQAYYEDKYFFYCPPITTPNATSQGECTGARIRDGASCTQSCISGMSRVFGTSLHTCSVGQWSGKELVCQPLCPSLNLPEHAESCSKVLMDERFDAAGPAALRPWLVAPAVPDALVPSFWAVRDGALRTDAGLQCSPEPYSVLTLSDPVWFGVMDPGQWIRAEFDVQVDGGSLAFVFRYESTSSYYFVEFDRAQAATLYGYATSSQRVELHREAWPGGAAYMDGHFHVALELVADTFLVDVEGTPLGYNFTDGTLPAGSLGFASAGQGSFDNLTLSTVCEGGTQCQAASDGVQCTFRCSAGYTAVSGDEHRVCSTEGKWSGGVLRCGLVPPQFFPGVRSVLENSEANTVVGAPLVATHEAATVAVTYTAIGGNGTDLFRVGLCDGQIRVRRSNSLDYEAGDTYLLEVAARPNGQVSAGTLANYTILILDAPEPPVFDDSYNRTVPESQASGVPFGAPVHVLDPEEGSVAFSLVPGSTGASVFGITPATGEFFVLPGAQLNFEATRAYELDVMAKDDSGLSAVQRYTVEVTDVNEAPIINDASLDVLESNADTNDTISTPVSAVDPEGNPITFAILGSGNDFFRIGASTGVLTFKVAATDDRTILVQASDHLGLSATALITVHIVPLTGTRVTGLTLLNGAEASTAGGDTVVVSGETFLPDAEFTAVYANAGLGLSFNATNCTWVSLTEVRCLTTPGVGTGLLWRMRMNGVPVPNAAASSGLLISYAPPNALAFLTPPGPLDTRGLQTVVITGENLYNDCNFVSVAATGEGAGTWSWTPTICDYDRVTVTTSAGAGAGLAVVVTVAGLDGLAPHVSYARPRIDSVVEPGPGLPTSGGGIVTITGDFFGPDDAPLSAQYGGGTDGRSYATTSCVRSVGLPHTEVSCAVVPGVGALHAWTLTVSAQASAPSANTTSYLPPSLSFLGGDGSVNANTRGGQRVLISGSNFGPPEFNAVTSVTYGRTGEEYTAASCVVLAVPQGDPEAIQCETVAGTGASLLWKVSIASQLSPPLGFTSYGPPSIAFFDGNGSQAASTEGLQTILINGNNFGTTLGPNSTVYHTQLEPVLNGSLPFVDVAPDTDGVLTFEPVDCHISVPHTQIQCKTDQGGGSTLQWTVVIDGQANRDPTTSYGAPRVTAITRDDGVTPARGMQGVPTDGNVTLHIHGLNFGPPDSSGRPLVQFVRYGRTGAEYAVSSFRVLSHRLVEAVVGPGVGNALKVSLSVADQVSGASSASFDYLAPSVLEVSPASGPAVPAVPVKARVTGRNFGLSDPSADIHVVFGNPNSSSTQQIRLPATPIFPPGDDGLPKHRANETVEFTVPVGSGVGRAVRVVVSRGGYEVFSDPDVDGSVSFYSYDPPVVTNTLSGVVVPNSTDSRTARTLLMLSPSADLTLVRKVTVIGKNFGPAPQVGLSNPQVLQTLESQEIFGSGPVPAPPVEANWGTSAVMVDVAGGGWSDTQIVGFSLATQAWVRVKHVSREYNTGVAQVVASNADAYTDVSPQVAALAGASLASGFRTAGGQPVTVVGRFLQLTTTLNITVGGRNCPVINGTGAIVPPEDVGQMLRDEFGPDADVYNVTCLVPEGQGRGVPILLIRDSVVSNALTINYAIPVVQNVTSVDPADPSATQVVTVSSGPGITATVLAPTVDGVLTLRGDNFGLTPRVVLGDSRIVSTSPFTFQFLSRSHTELSFVVPPGEGTAVPGGGPAFSIDLSVGSQAPLVSAIPFAYRPPTLSAVTSNSPTAGGTLAVLTGRNFGFAVRPGSLPSVYLRRAGRTPGEPATKFECLPSIPVCATPIVSRNHTHVVFTVPPGAGSELDVVLDVAGQPGSLSGKFSYARPVIHTSIADGIASVTGVNVPGNNAMLHANTSGGYTVTLLGENFGPSNDIHCAFVNWQGSTGTPLCNGLEDFAGEGEIAASHLVRSNHTAATFVFPPGLGTFELIWQAFDQVPARNALFQYEPPSLSDVFPVLFPTDGAASATLSGHNFGAVTPTPTTPLSFPLPLPLTDANRPVTGILVVQFGLKCMYTPYNHGRADPSALAQCLSGSISARDPTSVAFLSPSGIGANQTLSVFVVEPVTGQPGVRYINDTTASSVVFSFLPPTVLFITPSTLGMDSRPAGYLLEIRGENFGLVADVTNPVLPPSAREVAVSVGDAPCDNPERKEIFHPILGQYSVLTCALQKRVVGYKNMTLTVAGQTGPTLDADPAVNALHVVCSPGFYGLPGSECLPCPEGASCLGFVDQTHHLPVAEAGWYNLNGSVINSLTGVTLFDLCPDERGLLGRPDKTCVVPCEPAEACAGGNVCGTGYRDIEPNYRCSGCTDNYYRRSGECVKCPDAPWLLIVFFIAAAIGLAIGGWILNRRHVNIAFLSIGVDYFQVLAMFANSRVRWPAFVQDMFHVFSAFNFNLEITAPECSVPSLSYETKWWIIMQLPLGAMAVFGVIFLANLVYKRCVMCIKSRAKLLSHRNALIGMTFVLFYFMYLYLTRTVLDIFNCAPTEPPDGKEYLEVVFVECGTGMQARLVPFAVLYLFLYSVGYPALVAYILYKYRLLIMEDQLLVAKGTGTTRLTNPHCYDFRKRFHKLYYLFKPDLFFWILVILCRKFAIAFTGLMFNKNPAFQLSVSLLVMFVSYALQVRWRPYLSPSERAEVLRDHRHKALQGGVHAQLAAAIKNVEASGRKATRNVRMGAAQANAVAVAHYLFNYNTVEMVLLFCAVLINLAGIMFESDRLQSDSFKDQRDAITILCLVIIFASIVYFVVVVILEVYTIYQESNAKRRTKDVDSPSGKAAAKRARRATAFTGTQSVEMAALGSGVVPVDGEPNVGVLQTSVNPMFTRNQSQAVGVMTPDQAHARQLQLDVLDIADPPSAEVWAVVKNSYESLMKQVDSLQRQLADTKRARALSGADRTSRRSLVPRGRAVRKTFGGQMLSQEAREAQQKSDEPGSGSGSGAPSVAGQAPSSHAAAGGGRLPASRKGPDGAPPRSGPGGRGSESGSGAPVVVSNPAAGSAARRRTASGSSAASGGNVEGSTAGDGATAARDQALPGHPQPPA